MQVKIEEISHSNFINLNENEISIQLAIYQKKNNSLIWDLEHSKEEKLILYEENNKLKANINRLTKKNLSLYKQMDSIKKAMLINETDYNFKYSDS